MIQPFRLTLFLLLLAFTSVHSTVDAQDGSSIVITPLIGDHMVIQRDQQVKVWGEGSPGDRVQVSFQGESKMAKVPESGKWKIILKKPEQGGPFKMTINEVTFSDILVGDVWMAGGQSNMEWPLASCDGAQEELKSKNFPAIRFFRTPKVLNNHQTDILTDGTWETLNNEKMLDMSGVAYFFAKKLSKETGVPIGIVDHSWGGTDIEGWMPYESFEDYPEWKKKGEDFQNKTLDAEEDERALEAWKAKMDLADLGNQEQWNKKMNNWSGWADTYVPGRWEDNGHPGLDGIVWYSREFRLSDIPVGESTLNLGAIDDKDVTYINGVKLGATSSYNIERKYKVPSSVLKEVNVLTVRVTDFGWGGGFHSKAEKLFIETATQKVELAGTWKMKVGTENYPDQPLGTPVNNMPAVRYNGMMIPLFELPMTGMIWYQGESNCGRPQTYSDHFRNMINVYRENWGHEFPFLFVQLANYGKKADPKDSFWARLREAQESVLDMPKTGMATAIDIGEADDIHPRNKKDVGERLANAALSIEYNKDIPYKNPTVGLVTVGPEEIVLEFENIGLGLKAKQPKTIPAFHVQKKNGSYKRVKAELKGNKIYINIKDLEIQALFYAWADNPGELELFNHDGLPVVPFKVLVKYE